MRRKHFLSSLAALPLASMLGAQRALAQQAYPSKAIRLVSPYPIATSPDFVGGPFSARLAKVTEQRVNYERLAGLDGTIGSDVVAKSDPDGYTLLIGNELTHSANTFLNKKFPYSPVEDFTPIAPLFIDHIVIVKHPSFEATSIQQLIEFAKKNPKKLTIGSYGIGTTLKLASAAFVAMAEIDVNEVAYPNNVEGQKALLSGSIPVLFLTLRSAKPHIDKGTMNALGIAESKRYSPLPDLPTIGETLPGYETNAWYGLFGPAKMPAEVVKYLSEQVGKAMVGPPFNPLFGITIPPSTPEALKTLLQADLIVRERHIKAAKALAT